MIKCRLCRGLLTVVSDCLLIDSTSDLRSASKEIEILADGLILALAAPKCIIVKIVICFF